MHRAKLALIALALTTTPASAQYAPQPGPQYTRPRPEPIPPPPVPPYRCNIVPPYAWAFGLRGAAIFMNSYRQSCNQRYQIALQQWQAEMMRIQMLNQQRGYR